MKRTLALAALILAGAAAAPLPSLAASNVSLYISSAPPAPLYERVPAPRHAYAGAPGYRVAERPGYVYNAPVRYEDRGGGAMRPAAWTAYGGYDRGYRDRDRDGTPDRYERHRGGGRDQDRDGVPNRYDRDRDGDGVPNRYDRRPDNPWRR